MRPTVHVLARETTRPFGRQPEHELVAAFEDWSAADIEGRARYGSDDYDSDIPRRPGYRITTIPLHRDASSDSVHLTVSREHYEAFQAVATKHGQAPEEVLEQMIELLAHLSDRGSNTPDNLSAFQ